MAELYRHTDHAGDSVALFDNFAGGFIVAIKRGSSVVAAVDVPEVDGRRLIAALVGYYGPEELTEENDHA